MSNESTINPKTKTELLYWTEEQMLIVRFKGFIKNEDGLKDIRAIDDAFQNKPVKLLLINQRAMKVLTAEMQSVIVQKVSELVRKGINKMAFVLPEDIFAIASISKMKNENKTDGVEINEFHTEADAEAWLRKA
jgi:hypothetical protein